VSEKIVPKGSDGERAKSVCSPVISLKGHGRPNPTLRKKKEGGRKKLGFFGPTVQTCESKEKFPFGNQRIGGGEQT